MKKTAFIFLFSFSISSTIAQDTIFKRNNDVVVSKVLEITPTEIKYKKFNFQDGPTYIDKKSEIKMVVYSNGMKEAFEQEPVVTVNNNQYVNNINLSNKINDYERYFRYQNRVMNQPEMQNLLLSTKDKKIMGLVAQAKDSRRMELIGFAAIPLGIGAYGLFIASTLNGSSNPGLNDELLAGGAFCIVAAIACPIISKVNRNKKVKFNSEAIKLYNQKF